MGFEFINHSYHGGIIVHPNWLLLRLLHREWKWVRFLHVFHSYGFLYIHPFLISSSHCWSFPLIFELILLSGCGFYQVLTTPVASIPLRWFWQMNLYVFIFDFNFHNPCVCEEDIGLQVQTNVNWGWGISDCLFRNRRKHMFFFAL